MNSKYIITPYLIILTLLSISNNASCQIDSTYNLTIGYSYFTEKQQSSDKTIHNNYYHINYAKKTYTNITGIHIKHIDKISHRQIHSTHYIKLIKGYAFLNVAGSKDALFPTFSSRIGGYYNMKSPLEIGGNIAYRKYADTSLWSINPRMYYYYKSYLFSLSLNIYSGKTIGQIMLVRKYFGKESGYVQMTLSSGNSNREIGLQELLSERSYNANLQVKYYISKSTRIQIGDNLSFASHTRSRLCDHTISIGIQSKLH